MHPDLMRNLMNQRASERRAAARDGWSAKEALLPTEGAAMVDTIRIR